MQVVTVILLSFLAGIALLVLKLWWSRRHFFRLGDQIPGPKTTPFLGNLIRSYGDYNRKLQNVSNDIITYGSVFRLYLGPFLIVIVSNLNDIQTLSNNSKCCKRNLFFMGGIRSFIGDGLLTNAGELWKRHRKIINPTFKYKILEGFMGIFNANSHTLVKKLECCANNSTFDVFDLVWAASFDNIHETVMGVSYDVQNNNDSEKARVVTRSIEIIMERLRNPWLYLDCVFNKTKIGKECRAMIKSVNDLVDTTISMNMQLRCDRKLPKDTGEERSDKLRNLPFLEYMITAGETEEDLLSPLEIRDEAKTLAVTGFETTAATICFTLVLLSLHQEHQQQVAEELEAVIGDDPTRVVTTADLNKLQCLDRVMKETSRLFPAAPLNPRNIEEDVKLSSYTLPAGSVAVINYHGMMRDPELYPDPLKFEPDRFLPEAVSQRPPNSYMPFGVGPRMCIGYKYATMQMKVVLAHVLRSYEVLPACTREDIEDIENGIVMRPEGGFKLRLKPRVKRTEQSPKS